MAKSSLQLCTSCGNTLDKNNFIPLKNSFFPNGFCPICNNCLIKNFSNQPEEEQWNFMDRFCRFIDIPFDLKKWEKTYKAYKKEAIVQYALMYSAGQYDNIIDWKELNEEWIQLQKEEKLFTASEELIKKRTRELSKKWEGTYSLEELEYLEQTLNDLEKSFSITSGISTDQAKKLCKISLLIDQKIRVGADFDKLLKSYDTLIKIAGFSSENAKNNSDFESVGELCAFLEKKGFINKFYDGVKRDIVDETMANISANNRRWIMNETNIQDEAEKKLKALKLSQLQEESMNFEVYGDEAYDIKQVEKRMMEDESSIDEYDYSNEQEEEFVVEV